MPWDVWLTWIVSVLGIVAWVWTFYFRPYAKRTTTNAEGDAEGEPRAEVAGAGDEDRSRDGE